MERNFILPAILLAIVVLVRARIELLGGLRSRHRQLAEFGEKFEAAMCSGTTG
jgi:hypothetical protein